MENPFAELLDTTEKMIDKAIVDLNYTDTPTNRLELTKTLYESAKRNFDDNGSDTRTFGQSMFLIALNTLMSKYITESVTFREKVANN